MDRQADRDVDLLDTGASRKIETLSDVETALQSVRSLSSQGGGVLEKIDF